ncbi:hypothetical protein [Halorussus amylolyticus]|uniref:hypothetical protein n=1 Tax=Halorussus amylolyticus TaxID=1126242 RepID=UPI001046A1A6|nr:hypothetical protein [Halorussus amylolyticus]
MSKNNVVAGVTATVGNLFAWVSQTEQIWFPMASVYVKDIAEVYGLPDLRGPFLFLTLVYLGLRLGDLWGKTEDLDEL